MIKRLFSIGAISISIISAGSLYNDDYMSGRSGIVHESINTGIPNKVDGMRLLHWRGYITRLSPIIFDNNSCSSLDYLGQIIDNNRAKIRYISIIGHSSSITNDENRVQLRPWANMWHSLAGEHTIDKQSAVESVNSRIRYVYDYIKEHGISGRKIYNENRLDREHAYTEATKTGERLNNRVNVSIYSYSPLSIADLNIHFALNSDLIESKYDVEVEKFAEFMKNNPNMKVTIVGHTDKRGGYDYNMLLSKKRAESVKNRLVSLGINADRIHTEGVGYTQPVVKGNNERAYRMNRRIEAKLYL